MNAQRLNAGLPADLGSVMLLHANADQEPGGAFERTVQVARLRRGFRASQAQVGFMAAFAILRIGWRREADVLHAMSAYWLSLLPAMAARLVGMPTLMKVTSESTEAEPGDDRGIRALHRSLRLRLLGHVSGFVAISDKIEEQLRQCGVPRERIWRIPNGVDVGLFHPGAQGEATATGVRHAATRVLFAGAVTDRKRPHLLVEALACLASDRNVELWIAGPTDDEKYVHWIQELAVDLGVDQRIVWKGFVGDMAALYREVDLVCLPSASEGMANVVLEAMASGKPFVVTPASGMRELAQSGAGLVVDATPEGLAGGIREALRDRVLMGDAGRRAALREYSTEKVMERHLEAFRTLVG